MVSRAMKLNPGIVKKYFFCLKSNSTKSDPWGLVLFLTSITEQMNRLKECGFPNPAKLYSQVTMVIDVEVDVERAWGITRKSSFRYWWEFVCHSQVINPHSQVIKRGLLLMYLMSSMSMKESIKGNCPNPILRWPKFGRWRTFFKI